jgi:tetratricopeptide (TPR) repeat protein
MADKKGSEAKPGVMAPAGYQAGGRREGFGSAMIQIVIVLALVLGGLWFYWQKVQVDKSIDEIKKTAIELKKGDDVLGLLEARSKYLEVSKWGRTIEEDESVLTNMADITARLYSAYGLQEMRDEAKKYVDAAKAMDSRKPARYSAEAYLLIGDGDPAGAENVIRVLTDKGIREGRILHALSVAKLAQGKFKEAQTAAEEGMKVSTKLVRLPIAHGDTLVAQGSFAAARTSFGKALADNPDHIQAQTAVLLAQAVSGDSKPRLLHKQAKKLLERIDGMDPVPPRTKAFVEYVDGEVYLREAKEKTALEHADSALAAYPKLHEAHSLRGRALAGMKKADEAKAAFDAALAAVPTSLPYAQAGAEVLTRLKKPKWGVELLQKVTTASPDNGLAHARLAIAQANAMDIKGANASAAKAVEILGNNHEIALFSQARAYHVDGKLKEATESYENAIKSATNKEWAEVYYQMGILRFEEKDYEDSAALLKQAAKFYEKSGGTLDEIADSYKGIGEAYVASGGRKNKKAAQQWFDLAKKVRSGKG